MSMRSRIVVAAVALASLLQPLSAQRGSSVPSVSVRPPDFIYKVTAGAALPSLGWKIGVPIGALKAGSFAEAAGRVDALQLGYFEATPAELPDTLDEVALAAAARRIQELRLGLSAYYVAQLPEGAERIRQLFEFARRLNIETIVASPEPAALAGLDALAAEFNVTVALRNGTRRQTPAYVDPQGMLSAIAGRSARVGLAVDVAAWQREKIEPVAALRQVHRQVMAISLPDSAALAAAEPILLELSRLQSWRTAADDSSRPRRCSCPWGWPIRNQSACCRGPCSRRSAIESTRSRARHRPCRSRRFLPPNGRR